jgi:glycosyltransferase involved in cell wall biosynthesis
MILAHLTASTMYGGPERQMLGLARALPSTVRSLFFSFSEGGRCADFITAARREGFPADALEHDTPRLWAAARELTDRLAAAAVDVLCCNGYKANLLGRLAARRLGIPALAVSRGWTGESFRVRLYERLDRWHLRWMDRVVCVSSAQAAKVLRTGVRPDLVQVVPNAIDSRRFAEVGSRYRGDLESRFRCPPSRIVMAAGRLSPEKGFNLLVSAAARVRQVHPDTGFLLYGDGACRQALQRQIDSLHLTESFLLEGFRKDLDILLPQFDLFVLPSYTEGLPNVVLEACAAGVPVVATAVGGTPEVLADGVGRLTPPGDANALAEAIIDVLSRPDVLQEMAAAGQRRVQESFTFAAQAQSYLALFAELCPQHAEALALPTTTCREAGLPLTETCEA